MLLSCLTCMALTTLSTNAVPLVAKRSISESDQIKYLWAVLLGVTAGLTLCMLAVTYFVKRRRACRSTLLPEQPILSSSRSTLTISAPTSIPEPAVLGQSHRYPHTFQSYHSPTASSSLHSSFEFGEKANGVFPARPALHTSPEYESVCEQYPRVPKPVLFTTIPSARLSYYALNTSIKRISKASLEFSFSQPRKPVGSLQKQGRKQPATVSEDEEVLIPDDKHLSCFLGGDVDAEEVSSPPPPWDSGVSKALLNDELQSTAFAQFLTPKTPSKNHFHLSQADMSSTPPPVYRSGQNSPKAGHKTGVHVEAFQQSDLDPATQRRPPVDSRKLFNDTKARMRPALNVTRSSPLLSDIQATVSTSSSNVLLPHQPPYNSRSHSDRLDEQAKNPLLPNGLTIPMKPLGSATIPARGIMRRIDSETSLRSHSSCTSLGSNHMPHTIAPMNISLIKRKTSERTTYVNNTPNEPRGRGRERASKLDKLSIPTVDPANSFQQRRPTRLTISPSLRIIKRTSSQDDLHDLLTPISTISSKGNSRSSSNEEDWKEGERIVLGELALDGKGYVERGKREYVKNGQSNGDKSTGMRKSRKTARAGYFGGFEEGDRIGAGYEGGYRGR